jgi:deazaflavin-dependent oxidoreductase (nitroreductase family)
MVGWLWLPLTAAGVIAWATVYFRRATRTEAGRKRLLPLLRPVMRVMNPRVKRAVERRESPFGVLHHIGRRSGAAYHTPVAVGRTPGGVFVPLMYGPGTDWCRNIVAAGRCTLTFDGQELALTAPEVVPASVAEAQLPAETLRRWRGQGIAHYLSLAYAPRIEPERAPAASASGWG